MEGTNENNNKDNGFPLSKESVTITNLTAEIQTFVKSADSDQENLPKQNSTEHDDNLTILKIEEHQSNTEDSSKDARQSPENNEYYPESDSPKLNPKFTNNSNDCDKKLGNLGINEVNNNSTNNNCNRSKVSPVKILIRAPTEEDKEDDSSNGQVETKTDEINTKKAANDEYKNKFRGKKIIFKYKDDEPELSQAAKNTVAESENGVEKSVTQGNTTPKSTEVEFILEQQPNNDSISQINELKITESTDDLTTIASSPNDATKQFEVQNTAMRTSSPVLSRKTIDLQKEVGSELNENINNNSASPPKVTKFEIRNVPLKDFSPLPNRKEENVPAAAVAVTATENDVVIRSRDNRAPSPPQRRRSVKDIIEAINKSQSLLKINQKETKAAANKFDNKFDNRYNYKYEYKMNDTNFNNNSKYPTEKNNNNINYPNSNLDKNFNELSASDQEINKMILEMDKSISENEIKNIPVVVERFNELTKNNHSLFEKCVVRRDKAGTGVDDDDTMDESQMNVDWNPVPKPRRHRHATPQP